MTGQLGPDRHPKPLEPEEISLGERLEQAGEETRTRRALVWRAA